MANESVKMRRSIHVLGEITWVKTERNAYIHKIANIDEKLKKLQIELAKSIIQESEERSD